MEGGRQWGQNSRVFSIELYPWPILSFYLELGWLSWLAWNLQFFCLRLLECGARCVPCHTQQRLCCSPEKSDSELFTDINIFAIPSLDFSATANSRARDQKIHFEDEDEEKEKRKQTACRSRPPETVRWPAVWRRCCVQARSPPNPPQGNSYCVPPTSRPRGEKQINRKMLSLFLWSGHVDLLQCVSQK